MDLNLVGLTDPRPFELVKAQRNPFAFIAEPPLGIPMITPSHQSEWPRHRRLWPLPASFVLILTACGGHAWPRRNDAHVLINVRSNSSRQGAGLLLGGERTDDRSGHQRGDHMAFSGKIFFHLGSFRGRRQRCRIPLDCDYSVLTVDRGAS